MRDEEEKPTKSGDDISVGNMVQHEERVIENSLVERIQKQPQKFQKLREFFETESNDSGNDDNEK